MVHTLSFVLFLLVRRHGLLSSTDSTSGLALAIYWASGGSLFFLAVYRVLVRRYMEREYHWNRKPE